MEIKDLKPGDYLILSYETTKKKRIYYKVVATSNIKVYLLDDEGLENFENDKNFYTYNLRCSGKNYEEGVLFEYPGTYHLVIENPTDKDVVVSYEVCL